MQLVDKELCVTSAILEDISALSKLYDEATFEYKHNKEFKCRWSSSDLYVCLN